VGASAAGSSDRPGAAWWAKLSLTVALVFGLFQGSATALQSDRGQHGFVIASVVCAACWIVQRLVWQRSGAGAVEALGLARPATRGMACAGLLALLLVLVIPVFLVERGAKATMHPGWAWLLPGLFAQGGVAEEVLFRGYLFGAVRRHYTFWRAAVLSALPFVAAHLLLFTSMAWPIALASTTLALVSSFPLARLYELGGRTIWPPAILHFVIQGGLKVIDVTGDAGMQLTMTWFVAAALLPWLAFAMRPLVKRGSSLV
jgi:membrane protease YdiL (CAAX protease family)